MEDLLSISKPLIKRAEGLRLFPYKDTTGNTTIGYGRNLTAKGISGNTADQMLNEDLSEAIQHCKDKIDFFNHLDIPRQYILVNLAFNMGINGLLGFTKMLGFMKESNFEQSARELENSLEYKEVPNRIFPLIKILETGHFES